MRKPDGQYAIMGEHSAISRFIDPLPIRKVPGIGKVSSLSLLDNPETWNAFQQCPSLRLLLTLVCVWALLHAEINHSTTRQVTFLIWR
jgi:nucleotidyltransferase/DNA polymerase involved in DNA repair